MNLGPKKVAYIKPTRTGEEVLAIIFYWVFEQCLTMICFYFIGVFLTHCLRLFMLSSGFIYSDTLPHSSWKITLARWGVCEKHSPNLFFSSLRISSANSEVGELSHEAALSTYHHYHHQSLFIHEIVLVLGVVCKN